MTTRSKASVDFPADWDAEATAWNCPICRLQLAIVEPFGNTAALSAEDYVKAQRDGYKLAHLPKGDRERVAEEGRAGDYIRTTEERGLRGWKNARERRARKKQVQREFHKATPEEQAMILTGRERGWIVDDSQLANSGARIGTRVTTRRVIPPGDIPSGGVVFLCARCLSRVRINSVRGI